ncbi:unnamed protein product [Mycena citricolor]|uniref:Polyketide synthase n=1 Tax=Mycena citricolor TaxID=2018698 RepID=A0AAD2HV20_9AGAR|nr:unnamed protein product [Mycena citricolor]
MASEKSKIAVVGVAAQIPSGGFSEKDLDYRTFWDFLVSGSQAYQQITPELFQSSEFATAFDIVKFPALGAFLKNPDGLDTISFGISPKDARVMPFTARRLMELSFEALTDSGVDYRRQKVGCFMSGISDFEARGLINTDGSFAYVPSSLPNRISYALDLTGPSIQLDTACSSSLTALHLASQSIVAGDCSAALVGAAQINRAIGEWARYVPGGVLSPDGITKPFDDAADGFGRGEGAIVVVLKRLEQALRDKDQIYSVILGSAINATGSRMPLNVPSGLAQRQCINEAYHRAGKEFSQVDYAELHITGTAAGDPIEANTAGELFSPQNQLVAGSVKGNVGHLESAAFLVSLLKSSLILEHKIIPPTVNLTKPSTSIEWERISLNVPVQPTPLTCKSSIGRSVISISSAGIGGSTGHVVIESPPVEPEPESESAFSGDCPTVTVVVGGLSPRAVNEISQSLIGSPELRDADSQLLRQCAVTLSRRARQMPWRTAFTLPRDSSSAGDLPSPVLVPSSPPPLVFVLSGQGPQHIEMGRRLFSEFSVFRRTIVDLDQVHVSVMGCSLLDSTGLFSSRSSDVTITLSPDAWPVTITVAAIAMIQIALFDLLRSVGVRPDVLVGHSAGETTALYASGAGSKEMAFEIALARGVAMTVTESPDRGMASLGCNAEKARAIIASVACADLEISCFNSPSGVSVSGLAVSLDKAVAAAQGEGVFAQRIRTMVPGHSSFMEEIRTDYLSRMEAIFTRYPGPHVPAVPVYSTCTGETLVSQFTPEYFWMNCRNPVLFESSIGHILASHVDNPPVFLEISNHPVLASSILAHGVSDSLVLCPMRRASAKAKSNPTEHATFTNTLASLVLLGVNQIDFSGLYGKSSYKPSLIAHPLVHRPIPPPKTIPGTAHASRDTAHVSLNGRLLQGLNIVVNEKTHPLLAQHVVHGQPILPATGFLELVWRSYFLKKRTEGIPDTGDGSERHLGCRIYVGIFAFANDEPSGAPSLRAAMVLEIGFEETRITQRVHASGLMDSTMPRAPPQATDLNQVWDRLPKIRMAGFYESVASHVQFGPVYQRVVRAHGTPSEVILEVRVPSADEPWSNEYRLHPILLDACIHILLHQALSKEHLDHGGALYLPAQLGRFVYYGMETNILSTWISHIKRRSWAPDWKSYDVVTSDTSGHVVCRFDDLIVKRLVAPAPRVARRFDLVQQPIALLSSKGRDEPVVYRDIEADEGDLVALYRHMDNLALEMFDKSLANKDLVVGSEASRARYFSFAQRYHARNTRSAVPEDTIQHLRERYNPYFEVTSRIASVHDTVFASSKRAIDKLYSDDLMSRFYSREVQSNKVYMALSEEFSEIVSAIRQQGRRSINILEVGAGTGLLTRYIVDELGKATDVLVEYTVTDASVALASDLAQSIAYDKMVPRAYDLRRDPSSQGFAPQSFDIILALHVLHAVPDTKSCLASLKTLLIPGGYLFVVELDGRKWGSKPGSAWFDCVFGSFPEWFGFEDGREHCTMPPGAWMHQLSSLGFVNGRVCQQEAGEGHNFLFSAQKENSGGDVMANGYPPVADSRRIFRYSVGGEMTLQRAIEALDQFEAGLDVYVISLEGRNADSALGFCASLSREFPRWSIRLAIFASDDQIADASHLISQHIGVYTRGESVVYWPKDGRIPRVSRLALASAPDSSREAETEHMHLRGEDDLLVESFLTESVGSGLYIIAGRVAMSQSARFPAGSLILALTEKNPGRLAHLPVCSAVPIHHLPAIEAVQTLLDATVLSLIEQNIERSTNKVIYVALSTKRGASRISRSLACLTECRLLDPSDERHSVRLLLTDSDTLVAHPNICQWVPRSGRLVVVDTLLRQSLRDDSSSVLAHALQAAWDTVGSGSDPMTLPVSTLSLTPLFSNNKAYIILGGIGGLGVDLAVWMYQNGARHIVLTSRRGIESLDRVRDAESIVKIDYLRSRSDLELRLEACDATSVSATTDVLRTLCRPLGGCFQLTLVLSDALFGAQTSASFEVVRASKLGVFTAFASVVDMASLDFYVAFSSLSGLVGYAGQTNYASACSELNGALAGYSNAFSLIVPGILNAGFLDRASSDHIVKSDSGIFATSLTTQELWAILRDGLSKIASGHTFSQYIPDLDWKTLNGGFPLSPTFSHLISERIVMGKSSPDDQILPRVLAILEVDASDFDWERPLISYGLDSLTATRLSTLLQPFCTVSQLELLGGISWDKIAPKLAVVSPNPDSASGLTVLLDILGVDARDFDPSIPLISYGLDSLSAARLATALKPYVAVTQLQLLGNVSWADLSRVAPAQSESIVELVSGAGAATPLFVFCGGEGSLAPLLALRTHFKSRTLYGVQITPATPLATLPGLARYFVSQMQARQAHGPYRIAAYSQSSFVCIEVARILEADGERVEQLAFIDHFPTLWLHPELAAIPDVHRELSQFFDYPIQSMIAMFSADPLYRSSGRAEQLKAAAAGVQDSQDDLQMVEMTRALIRPILEFLRGLGSQSWTEYTAAVDRWLSSVEAPYALVVAEFGIGTTIPRLRGGGDWEALGAKRHCSKEVEVYLVEGVGHYGILGTPELAQLLQ